MGRKPHPTWRRKLDGNPSKQPLNALEPQLPATFSTFEGLPRELVGDQRATSEWQRVAPMLHKGRQITDADRASLVALCLEWSRYIAAVERLSFEGMIVFAGTERPMVSPYIVIARQALLACTKLWSELGMTPSSRSKVQMVAGDEPDAFSEFDQPVKRTGSSSLS